MGHRIDEEMEVAKVIGRGFQTAKQSHTRLASLLGSEADKRGRQPDLDTPDFDTPD
jgi:hypothetical protein